MPNILKREKFSPQLSGSIFFFSLQVIVEGARVVTALFTITILFVSQRRINEFMRSCLFDDHNAWGKLVVHQCSILVSWIIHHTHTHTQTHKHSCALNLLWKEWKCLHLYIFVISYYYRTFYKAIPVQKCKNWRYIYLSPLP